MCASRNYSQEMPELPREELGKRVAKLVPFWVDKESKMCFELRKNDPFSTSFLWERKEVLCLGEMVRDGVYIREGEEENLVNVFETREYITLHEFGYYAFFKPSLAEIARFLPKELFDDHEKLYVTSEALYMRKDDCYPIGTDQGVHVAKTTVLIKNI
ncbi:conserved hypothetical protein [Lausannevirus]|uniref:Uncharacterized protein n=1 Tax=Lausannevirus TaxID=999883 RepID=F2WL38_9VIRU|nr:hypothetical protein LAU_0109 [Lausannevirus]AEA06961.1 conserved hypothetical protein [Lausannevirus]